MVLWEITLGTAYFLGLKRTYKLALKLQRRLIGPNHPRIQQFVYRRTRAVFDIALTVHRKIQERDLEVGKNVGNWVLRWLDRMKPSAQIRAITPKQPASGGNTTKHVTKSDLQQPQGTIQKSNSRSADPKSDGRLFTSAMNMMPKSFPTWMHMMRPTNPTGTNTQYRQLCIYRPDMPRVNYGVGRYEGVIRKDIMQWMVRN